MSFYRRPTYIIFSLKNHITLEKISTIHFQCKPMLSSMSLFWKLLLSHTVLQQSLFASKRQVYLFFLNIL